jgi:membrane peptidoglycan carboxypeptidase
MRAKRAKRLDGAPRGGRWARRVTGRKERKGRPYGAILLAIVGLLIIGSLAAVGWTLDRQLRGGILEQRKEATRRPDWVPLRSLPPYVPAALLTVVDPSFLERTVYNDLAANTLPRELVRQVHLLPSNLSGQGKELILGPLLENRLTKRAILELYLNRVYLGQDEEWPVFGLYHAAHEHFGKDPTELTLSEAATLAGLLLPPRIEDPAQQPGAVGARRNEVLRQMLLEGTIDAEAYRAAISEPLQFQPGPEYEPMTRPRGWAREPEVIRVRRNPPADSAGRAAG